MSKRIFSKEQIESILKNESVAGCSEKSVSYHKNFKILAVKKYQEGLPASAIFKQAGFNIDALGRDAPHDCLSRWRKTFKEKGEVGLKTDGRGKGKFGGRPKSIDGLIADLPDEEKIKRLKLEVSYLKEENRFLAKLRKKSLN